MNLYTQLVERETKRFQHRIDHINGQLGAILRAEKLKDTLVAAGIPATLKADEGCFVYMHIEAPIEDMSNYTPVRIAAALGRSVCPDSNFAGDAYLILPNDNEERWASLPLVMNAY